MATEHLIRRNPFLSTLPECFDLLVWHCGRRSGWKEGLRVLATNGSQEFRRQRRLRVCMLGDVDRIGRRNPSCVSRQEASCRRYKVVPIIGLKITRVELATEKLIESLPCCKKIENFLLPFFSLAFIFICVRVWRKPFGTFPTVASWTVTLNRLGPLLGLFRLLFFFPVLRASACAPNNKWISKIVVAIFFLSLSLPPLHSGSLSCPAEESVDSDGASLVQSSLQDSATVCARKVARSCLHRQFTTGKFALLSLIHLPSIFNTNKC